MKTLQEEIALLKEKNAAHVETIARLTSELLYARRVENAALARMGQLQEALQRRIRKQRGAGPGPYSGDEVPPVVQRIVANLEQDTTT